MTLLSKLSVNRFKAMLYVVKNRLLLSFLLAVLAFTPLKAQQLHWIYLTDKDERNYQPEKYLSTACLENRKMLGIPLYQYSDIPVNKNYISLFGEHGIELRTKSKWLNAVSSPLGQEQIAWLKTRPFVKAVIPFGSKMGPTVAGKSDGSNAQKKPKYTPALEQIGAEYLVIAGYNGKGITVGLIDAGFRGANKGPFLKHLYMHGKVLGTRDRVKPNTPNFYESSDAGLDSHGSTVLKHVAGYDSVQEQQTGFATDAQFYLCRTDDAAHEFRGEEDYWLSGMEWMDSLGVRLINTSLGYSLGFDKRDENYKPTDMTGNTSAVVKAAEIAVNEKKITVVVSAGNDGDNDNWRYINTPADGKSVISVGATLGLPYAKAGYSGIGPAYLPYVKPEISCYSLNGTSFSAPVITGFVACLLQANPKLLPTDIKAILEQSGNLYPYCNNYIGFGYPNSEKALQLALEPKRLADSASSVKLIVIDKDDLDKNGAYILKVRKTHQDKAVVFHKQDMRQVISQDIITLNGSRAYITHPSEARRTTVMVSGRVWELVWPGE